MRTRKKMIRATLSVACLMCVPAFIAVAQANSVVPDEWNVAPMTAGAYLESFDSETSPAWSTGDSTNTVAFPSFTSANVAARSNEWFGANSGVLELNTLGTVLTNALEYANTDPVSFATRPVYVDMKVFFEVADQIPSEALLGDAKVAIYALDDATPKLVVVHATGSYTNSAALDTNVWHQLTIKLHDNTVDVLLADEAVVTGLTPRNHAQNELKSVNFYGTGFVDELYVSHGNPAYAVPGPTTSIDATLPADGDNPPTDEQQTRINAWLSNISGLGDLTALSQDQLSSAYLLDELDVDGGGVASPAFSITFGVSSINRVSPTEVSVTVKLEVNGFSKGGTINGKIQLQGSETATGTFTALATAVTPDVGDFTGGEATYTFTLPSSNYKFFKATIIP